MTSWFDDFDDDSSRTYTPQTYGHSFSVRSEAREVFTIQPSWFARVFLRRKPRVVALDYAAALLARRAWQAERKLVESIYRDGK
jgi:hypothetical protein